MPSAQTLTIQQVGLVNEGDTCVTTKMIKGEALQICGPTAIRHLVPMPEHFGWGVFGGRGYLVALCGSGGLK